MEFGKGMKPGSHVWMRCCQPSGSNSDCQCEHRNSPGFYLSILVKSEGRQMKHNWINYSQKYKPNLLFIWKKECMYCTYCISRPRFPKNGKIFCLYMLHITKKYEIVATAYFHKSVRKFPAECLFGTLNFAHKLSEHLTQYENYTYIHVL